MSLDRFRTLTEIITSWITVIGLAGGGLFAVCEYLTNQRHERVKETLSFLDSYNEEHMRNARKVVSEIWRKRENEMNEILNDKQRINDFNPFVLQIVLQENIRNDLVLLIGFFEALEVCVASSICDGPSAAAFFGREGRAIYRQYYAFITSERKKTGNAEYGKKLLAFTKRK